MSGTKRLAACSLIISLSVVVLLLGAVLELGIYLAPLIASLALIPIGQKYGRKYHLTAFFAVSLLSFMLVPNVEQNLLFLSVIGWYPAARGVFQKLPALPRVLLKLLLFSAAVIAVEALVMLVLIPEAMGAPLLIIFLILMIVLLFCFDRILPYAEILLRRLLKYI